MSILAKIKPQIWNDPDFRKLDPQGKLAFVWLLSNWSRNNVGLTVAERQQFEFDTGVSFDVLLATVQTFRHSLCQLDTRQTQLILSLNFISHQLTEGQLSAHQTMGKSVRSEARSLPGVLRDRFFERYPLLKVDTVQTQRAGSGNPATRTALHCTALNGTESGSGEGTGEGVESPSDAEVFAYSKSWPGEPASGLPVMDLDWAARWLARMLTRASGWPPNWRRAMVACWREDWRGGMQKNGGSKNGGSAPPRPDGTWGLKQRLEELRVTASRHPGNRQSSAYVDNGPEELEQDYEKICGDIAEIEKKLTEAGA